MYEKPALPPEILSLVFSYLPSTSQATLCSATFVSRQWYSSAIKDLYRAPIVKGNNFDRFVRAVCPSINAHVRNNGLAGFIQKLDLSYLVHNGSKSLTARLLGRVKNNLEEFIAPQASFGINCLAALSKCSHLKCLNLRWVSEGISLFQLLRSIQGLDRLVTLHLPRAASHATMRSMGETSASWPKNLRELHFNGNFLENNSVLLDAIPLSTSSMYFENCPSPKYSLVASFFKKKGPQLEFLRLSLGRENRGWTFVFIIGQQCSHLKHLSMNMELLIDSWQSKGQHSNSVFFPNVEIVEIDSFANHDGPTIDSYMLDLSDLFYNTGVIPPKLRKLLFCKEVKRAGSKMTSESLTDLDMLFKALAREDGKNASTSEEEAGVAFLV